MNNYIPNGVEAFVVEPAGVKGSVIDADGLRYQPIIGWRVGAFGGGLPIGEPVTVARVNEPYAVYFPKTKWWQAGDLGGTGLDALAAYFHSELNKKNEK